MHAKPDLRVFLKWMIAGSGSVIADVIRLGLLKMLEIVRETPEHIAAVRRLTIDAFDASEFGHSGEAELIDQLRDQSDDTISLIAIIDNEAIGHVLFSNAIIQSAESTSRGMGLGPMAVQPEHQNQGIGSQLVREGLRMAAETDSTFTLVVGHPDFYPEFGFLPANQFSITHGFAGIPQEMLFIHCHDKNLFGKLTNGRAIYHNAFGPQFGG